MPKSFSWTINYGYLTPIGTTKLSGEQLDPALALSVTKGRDPKLLNSGSLLVYSKSVPTLEDMKLAVAGHLNLDSSVADRMHFALESPEGCAIYSLDTLIKIAHENGREDVRSR